MIAYAWTSCEPLDQGRKEICLTRPALGPHPSTWDPERTICCSGTGWRLVSRVQPDVQRLRLLPKSDGQRPTWGDPKCPFLLGGLSLFPLHPLESLSLRWGDPSEHGGSGLEASDSPQGGTEGINSALGSPGRLFCLPNCKQTGSHTGALAHKTPSQPTDTQTLLGAWAGGLGYRQAGGRHQGRYLVGTAALPEAGGVPWRHLWAAAGARG